MIARILQVTVRLPTAMHSHLKPKRIFWFFAGFLFFTFLFSNLISYSRTASALNEVMTPTRLRIFDRNETLFYTKEIRPVFNSKVDFDALPQTLKNRLCPSERVNGGAWDKYTSRAKRFMLEEVWLEESLGRKTPARISWQTKRNLFFDYVFKSSSAACELYINRGHIAYGFYGINAAAETIFGVPLQQLLIPQARHKLDQVVKLFLQEPQKNRLELKRQLRKHQLAQRLPDSDSAAAFIQSTLHEMQERKIDTSRSYDIYTTLDTTRQKRAEVLSEDFFFRHKVENRNLREAMLKIPALESVTILADVASGEILSQTNSARYAATGTFNRAILARRQVSSAFKAFVYARAFEKLNITPQTIFEDKPLQYKNRDGSAWTPHNYYNGFIGDITLEKALKHSINTISIQLVDKMGVSYFAEKAEPFFFAASSAAQGRIPRELSIALGAVDLTPIELLRGYLVLARNGMTAEPHFIRRIATEGGTIVYERPSTIGHRILDSAAAAITTQIMRSVLSEGGTAGNVLARKIDFDVAGKSGSSPQDSWFVGYNPETVILVWAGYDDPKKAEIARMPLFVTIPFWAKLMQAEKPTIKHFAR